MDNYNPILDGDQYHNDDISVVDQPIDRVNRIKVDYDAAATRNRNYIRENIANEKRYQEKLAEKLVN